MGSHCPLLSIDFPKLHQEILLIEFLQHSVRQGERMAVLFSDVFSDETDVTLPILDE